MEEEGGGGTEPVNDLRNCRDDSYDSALGSAEICGTVSGSE